MIMISPDIIANEYDAYLDVFHNCSLSNIIQ